MKLFKEYEIPTVELIYVDATDVLTSSGGFNGEEHDLLETPYFEEV